MGHGRASSPVGRAAFKAVGALDRRPVGSTPTSSARRPGFPLSFQFARRTDLAGKCQTGNARSACRIMSTRLDLRITVVPCHCRTMPMSTLQETYSPNAPFAQAGHRSVDDPPAGPAGEGDAAARDRGGQRLPAGVRGDCNRRFGVSSHEPSDAHWAGLHDDRELDLILCEQHARKMKHPSLSLVPATRRRGTYRSGFEGSTCQVVDAARATGRAGRR